MRILFYFVLFSLVSSCGTLKSSANNINQWQNKSANDLLKTWGTPNQTIHAENGHTFYIYLSENYSNYSAPTTAGLPTITLSGGKPVMTTSAPTLNSSLPLQCITRFEADKQNKIIFIQQMGDNCIAPH